MGYLPFPNKIELIISEEQAPTEETATAFAVPFISKNKIVFTQNLRRRGTCLEIPGGHIEKGETAEMAAIRETMEETGCGIEVIKPFGFIKMTSEGTAPEDWRYAHPVSYQQIFLSRVISQKAYKANKECLEPVIIDETNKRKLDRLQEAIFDAAQFMRKHEK